VISRFFWFIAASSILTIVYLLIFSNQEVYSKIVLTLAFLAFLPMYAVSAMISSWINEHEADMYGVKVAGFEPMAKALVKLHVYNSIKDYEKFVTNVEFVDTFELDEISYFDVLKVILRKVFVYMNPQNVLSQPLPETHLSLRLRLHKIISV